MLCMACCVECTLSDRRQQKHSDRGREVERKGQRWREWTSPVVEGGMCVHWVFYDFCWMNESKRSVCSLQNAISTVSCPPFIRLFDSSAATMYDVLRRISFYYLMFTLTILTSSVVMRQHRPHQKYSFSDYDNDLSLWIDEQQVKRFSGKFKYWRSE